MDTGIWFIIVIVNVFMTPFPCWEIFTKNHNVSRVETFGDSWFVEKDLVRFWVENLLYV